MNSLCSAECLSQNKPHAKRVKRFQDVTDVIERLTKLSTCSPTWNNLPASCDEALEIALDLAGADMGTLQLLDSKSDALELVAHRGFPHPFPADFAAADAGQGASWLRRQVSGDNLRESPVFTGTGAGNALMQAGVRAVQTMPLVSRDGQPVGILALFYRQPGRTDDLNHKLLGLLAVQTANVIVLARAQQALKTSRDKHHLLFNSISEGFLLAEVIFNDNRRPVDVLFIEANYAAIRIIGQDVTGKRLGEIDPNSEPEWLTLFGFVSTTGKSMHQELYAATYRCWYSLYVFAMGSAGRRRIGITFQDVTAHKCLESELRLYQQNLEQLVVERTEQFKRSERHYRTLLEHLPMAIFQYDTALRFIYAAKNWHTRIVADNETMMGKSWEDLGLPAELYQKWRENLIAALTTGQEVEFETQYTSQQGDTKDYVVHVVPVLDELGKAESLISIAMDVTEYKRVEAEILRLDRLNTVGEMAAAIGHEVRNPLTTVRGYLQFLQRKAETSEYREQFSTMIEELDRANLILSDFLSLAKNKVLVLKPGNINHVLQSLLPLIHSEALHLGHDLEIAMGEIPDIPMDDKEVRQLFLNITRNGFEAMQPGGKLRITTAVEGDQVILAVRDNGQGIPAGILAKLGTPFVTTKENGTGLGLAVCYRIANRHGARIAISTSPEGTTLSVHFPLVP